MTRRAPFSFPFRSPAFRLGLCGILALFWAWHSSLRDVSIAGYHGRLIANGAGYLSLVRANTTQPLHLEMLRLHNVAELRASLRPGFQRIDRPWDGTLPSLKLLNLPYWWLTLAYSAIWASALLRRQRSNERRAAKETAAAATADPLPPVPAAG